MTERAYSDAEAVAFAEGLLAAAREVETHWNDAATMVNQREQARRSAETLRRLQSCFRRWSLLTKAACTGAPGAQLAATEVLDLPRRLLMEREDEMAGSPFTPDPRDPESVARRAGAEAAAAGVAIAEGTKGERVQVENFAQLEPGQYAHCLGNWYARTPSGLIANLARHEVKEHEDGTISASPSILVEQPDPDNPRGEPLKSWHGYLRRGVWILA